MRKYYSLFLLCALCLFVLGGCHNLQTAARTEAQQEEGTYRIYYKNNDNDNLVYHSYQAESDTFDALLSELLGQMAVSPVSGMNSVLGDETSVNNCTRGVDTISVDVSSGYLGMSERDRVLLRAAMVKTLTQLPGVTGIYMTVEGQSITNAAGEEVGLMNVNTFIESSSEGINSARLSQLTLYFASDDGAGLVEENRTVTFSSNVPIEQVVVQEIINGSETGNGAVLSTDTEIRSVKPEGDICTIDLGSAFNTVTAGVEPETALYALVDAVCANSECTGVRFLIEGSSSERFWDSISLDQTFQSDSSLIRSGG